MILMTHCLWTPQSLIAFFNLYSTPEKYACTIITPLKTVNWGSTHRWNFTITVKLRGKGTESMLYKFDTTIFFSVPSPSDQLFPLIYSGYLNLQMCLAMKTHQNIIAIFLNFQIFRTDFSYSIFHSESWIFCYSKLALCPDLFFFLLVKSSQLFWFLGWYASLVW